MWGSKKTKTETIEEEKKIEEVEKPQELKRSAQQMSSSYSGNLTSSSSSEENFVLVLGGGSTPFDSTDPTLLWSYNIPVLAHNEKRRIIEIMELNAILQNYKDSVFPNRFTLAIDGVTGFGELVWDKTTLKWKTQSTNKLMTAFPADVDSRMSSSSDTLNVIYKGKGESSWDIGMMATLNVRLLDEDGVPVETPFNNPIHLCLKIIHLGL